MEIDFLEKSFASFLEEKWPLSQIDKFILTYIDLLLLFKDDLQENELNAILERKKQLQGSEFSADFFDEVLKSSRKGMTEISGDNDRKATLNSMLFCALLDSEETDFFYLTEPIFEFSRIMKISTEELKGILESEFSGFRIGLA